VHIAPFRTIGVVLITQMVHAIFIKHAVGVVHPSVRRCVVIGWSIKVGVLHLPAISQAYSSRL
jgi:hypothetical protein